MTSIARKSHRRLTVALAAIAVLLALLLALVGAAWWVWRSDAGPARLLQQVPGLKVSGLQGRPDGGPFKAARIEWQSGGTELSITSLTWRDLQWRWRPYPGAWLGLELVEPRAERVQVTTAPDTAEQKQSAPPKDLRPPVELVVRGLQVDALHLNDEPPVLGLRGDLHLGADAGRLHRIGLAARRDPLQASVEARIGAVDPLGVDGTLVVGTPGGAALPWRADVRLGGTVPSLTVDGTVTAGAGARLGVQATLTPFERWPLASLRASANELDLSTVNATWPGTRLSGRAVIESSGRQAPLSADLDLRNAEPGAWDAARLPLSHLRATVRGHPAQPDVLEFAIAEAALHGRDEAGRLSGTGRWQGSELSLSLALDAVQPARIDARAAPMTIGGPVRLTLRGLPSPAPASPPASKQPLAGELHADLTGRLHGGPASPLRVLADASFSAPADGALHARMQRVELSAAEASATLSAEVRRDARQAWHVKSDGRFVRFDPAHWWAGPAGSAWRRGPHALNGEWNADIVWPQAAAPQTPRALLRALRGQATLALSPSRLAGVPLLGTATMQAGERATQIDGTLQAASNRAVVQLHADDNAADERWQFELRAPALPALAPLGRLVPGAEPWLPTAGTLSADVMAQGRWPALRTEGSVRAAGVQAAAWRIGRLHARWSATPGRADAPLSLTLAGSGLAQGEQRIETLAADLSGTLASHRFQLRAASPLRPPDWTDAVVAAGAAPSRGTALQVAANGAWTPATPGGGIWRGRIDELTAVAQPRSGTPWIEARGIAGELRLGPQGALEQASLEPGRVRLLGATLQWADARFQAGPTAGTPPRIALDARLDPLPVAPWLMRAQPQFGWSGDLRVGGTFRVTSGQRFDADVVLQRAGGDLAVTDETGTHPLGLTDLRLALAAHDGNWQFTQALAGRRVGVLSGSQTLRSASPQSWPTADAPLQGSLELRVPELGPWSAWLPPGWRLDGRLRATAAIGGRLGAPRYTGDIAGSQLSARNLLQGVYLHDGVLGVALRGDEARIDRLMFRGGDGTLQVEGAATLGDAPGGRFRILAQRFQALSRLDRRVSVSGQADVALAPERLGVDGRFVVDEGLVDVSQADAPQLDEDVTVVNRPSPTHAVDRAGKESAAAKEAPRSPWKDTVVSLVVDLGENLRLVGRGMQAGLRGQLRITTPEGRLAVHGTVRTERGTYAAYGQNLSIERGVVLFAGDVSSPRLDILAVRPDIDVRVGVAIQGSALQPRVRLYSEPEMSEMDKLSWLVMGRASEGLGRADTALLQRAALALVAGEGSGDSPGLVKRLGLDELSVKRGESGEVADTVVTLGRQLSQRWYVGYERGLNAAAGSWQMIYRIARRFTLRLQTGDSRALDVIWTWRWN